ncbi:4Fe-4S ferredoxin, partial [Candidatus Bipolaricaulota bacterium]|nr:4Fe-4S ferredoxin [Candidatus Bipolaricaulota bacterium]
FDAEVAPGQVYCPGSEGVVEACPVTPGGISRGAPAEGDSDETVFTSAPFPYQLGLVSSAVPWLRGADVVLAADCVAYAYPDFGRLRGNRPLLIACPKLDNVQAHLEKLTDIMRELVPASVTVLRMEVPCCSRLAMIAEQAIELSGKEISLSVVTITIGGEIQSSAG